MTLQKTQNLHKNFLCKVLLSRDYSDKEKIDVMIVFLLGLFDISSEESNALLDYIVLRKKDGL